MKLTDLSSSVCEKEKRKEEEKKEDRKARYPGQLEGDPPPTAPAQPFHGLIRRARCMLTAITLSRYALRGSWL